MLSIIPAVMKEAADRIEAARQKFNPSEEEKNPNMKFVRNSLAPILVQDPDFQKIIAKEKLSWEQYDALLRKLYDSIKSKDYFASYMSSPASSLDEDVKLFIKIFEEEFVDNDDLADILEDLSITCAILWLRFFVNNKTGEHSSPVLFFMICGTMWASSPTVSQKIKSFKILVTKTIGKPIFQRSFYDHVIRDEKDYLRIWEYIENNPGKWAEDPYYI